MHIDLESGNSKKKKLEMENPVVIKLDEVVKLIITCSGEKYVFQFVNSRDLVVY